MSNSEWREHVDENSCRCQIVDGESMLMRIQLSGCEQREHVVRIQVSDCDWGERVNGNSGVKL